MLRNDLPLVDEHGVVHFGLLTTRADGTDQRYRLCWLVSGNARADGTPVVATRLVTCLVCLATSFLA